MELLYIVGILLALALLVRGGLWLRDYQRRLRIKLEPVPPGPEAPEGFSELGQVRVRPRLDQVGRADEAEPTLGPVIVVSPRGRADEEGARVTAVSPSALRAPVEPAGAAPLMPSRPEAPLPVAPASDVPAHASLADDTAWPLEPPAVGDVEPRSPAALGSPTTSLVPAGQPAATEAAEASLPPAAPTAPPIPAVTPEPSAAAAPSLASAESVPLLLTPVATPLPEAAQQDMFANDMIAPPPMPDRTRSRAEALYGAPAVEPVCPVRAPEVKPAVEVQDVIALHVVAREHPFNGEDLLRCILGYGLRFGDMSIFHRHERPTGQGEVLFSMASAVEPGTFDLQAMSGQEILGVSFFQSLPGVNSIHAYDIMVDTAKRLAIELQGDLLDQQQQPLTRQLVEHYRERVQEFERRRLMQRPAR